MVKRKEATDLLSAYGFHATGGTNHEDWTDGEHFTQVLRHREISNQLFARIKKQTAISVKDRKE